MSKTYRRNKKGEEYQDKDRPNGTWWRKGLPKDFGKQHVEKGSQRSFKRREEKDYADHTTD